MIQVIRLFPDRMRACAQIYDGRCLEWFEVARGLRRGFVISPPLFKVFFAAILQAVLERFSKGADVRAYLVHLQEQRSQVSPESALERVRRSIWGMRYADNAFIVSQSPPKGNYNKLRTTHHGGLEHRRT